MIKQFTIFLIFLITFLIAGSFQSTLPIPPKSKPLSIISKFNGLTAHSTQQGDSNPKKAPSAYTIFCSEKRPELRATHPNATFGEMSKMLGKMWAQLDEQAKADYQRESASKKAENGN